MISIQTKRYSFNLKKNFPFEFKTLTQQFFRVKLYSSMATFNRTTLEEVLKKRFFYTPSFQIYGGKLFLSKFLTSAIITIFHIKFSY